MASMEEVIERLARLEEKTDAQKKNLQDLKQELKQSVEKLDQSVKELDKKVNSMDRKIFVLWIIATGGLSMVFSVVYNVIAHKIKSIFGGQT